MAMDLGQLFRKDYALQANLEATCALVRQRHISRVLPSAHQNVELLPLLRVVQGAYRYCAAWPASKVVLTNLFKGLGVEQLGVPGATRSEQHREVVGHRQLIDQRLMDLAVFDGASGANINDLYLSCLCAHVERLVKGSPHCASELMLVDWRDFSDGFGRVLSVPSRNYRRDVVDADVCHLVEHVQQQELAVSKGQRHLDLEVAWHEHRGNALTILHVEDLDALDGGGQHVLRVLGHVDRGASR